ncbi:MAG TPA: BON domain-containing protein, partial [Ottowia sp.]|nr:BON domain-containing protein [Ottowia sp.]
DTSVWVLGQRRIVTLKGCVRSVEQGRLLEQTVGLVDDVMGVVNQLYVLGETQEPVPYRVAR